MKRLTFLSGLLLICAYSFAQSFTQIVKVVAADRAVSDRFSKSVAISGNYAIIGAHRVASDANGNNPLPQAGAAYIFEKTAGTWVQVQKITAAGRAAEDNFGTSVAISGNTAIVGAYKRDEPNSQGDTLRQVGAVYIFEKDTGGDWQEVQKLLAPDMDSLNYFGKSVAISGDYLIAGAAFRGGVDGAGNMLPEAGAAYIFERNADGTWMDKQEIVASNPEEFSIFGWSVGISGNHAVVGAYKKDQGSGTQYKTDAGAVYVFERDDSGTWNEVQELAAANNNGGDWLGYSVAISNDYIVAGAYQQDGDENGENSLPDAGAAYIFEKNPSGLWEEKQKLVAGDRGVEDQFAYAVSISGEFALIGARQEDEDFDENNPLTDAGSAYVFEKEGNAGAWNQVQKLTAADRSSGDWFGFSVAIDGGDALAGAFSDNRDAQGDNILNQAGSAYFFESSGTTLAGEISMDAKEISLSPNPAFSEVAIVAVEAMIKQVDIFDLNGRLVASKSGGSKSISINVHSLLSGIYILKIATDRKGILFKNLLKF